jgi:hypothetical protein
MSWWVTQRFCSCTELADSLPVIDPHLPHSLHMLTQRNCTLLMYTIRPLRCGEAVLTSLTTMFTAITCPYKEFCATSVSVLWVGSFILKGKILHYRRHLRQIKMNIKFYVKCNVFLLAASSLKRWWNIICEVLKIEAFFTLFCAVELQLYLEFKLVISSFNHAR